MGRWRQGLAGRRVKVKKALTLYKGRAMKTIIADLTLLTLTLQVPLQASQTAATRALQVRDAALTAGRTIVTLRRRR